MKILVTGGGSEEPIDNVRAVCNFSTGKTSAFLSDFFSQAGNDVTEIVSQKGVKPCKAKFLTYRTFSDLAALLEKECREGNYDAVVHAAAVSDYSPVVVIVDGKEYQVGEFSKVPAGSELTIRMKKNPKLVDSIKMWCKSKTKVIAFKLTSNASLEERKAAVKKIFDANENLEYVPDYVVSNDLSEITEKIHPCRIFDKNMDVVCQVSDLEELGNALLERI